MPARPFLVLVVATLILITISGASASQAQDLFGTGESYWGEHTVNAMFDLWPALVIMVFTGLLAGAMFGFYELDRVSAMLFFGASVYLGYHFYWLPAHIASGLHFLGL